MSTKTLVTDFINITALCTVAFHNVTGKWICYIFNQKLQLHSTHEHYEEKA